MLAPRKTLWSTPEPVITKAFEWIEPYIQDGTRICDIGCGDGRVILEWAQRCPSATPSASTTTLSFIGIDIDAERIQQANQALAQARQEGRIAANVAVEFVCRNALEATDLLQNVTILFLYLIPRGLRILQPILRDLPLHVVTYMSPLPGETFQRRELIPVPHQPGAAWPLYLYHLNAEGAEDGST